MSGIKIFLFSSVCKHQRKDLLKVVRMVYVCWDLEEQREIPASSYSDLYKGPVQMVFQESKKWIINSYDYEIVEKHLWKSLNLSGLASWSGKENYVELIRILYDQ